MDKFLWVSLGAGLGGTLRYLISVLVILRYTGQFPLATFLINVTGSFAIGVLMTKDLCWERPVKNTWGCTYN